MKSSAGLAVPRNESTFWTTAARLVRNSAAPECIWVTPVVPVRTACSRPRTVSDSWPTRPLRAVRSSMRCLSRLVI
ncbi:Uncharacterised protein [Mycobacteroides abscessus subsp. abscessus]|nr:Uncharacterised protein [Mycobacteroides abscessus subsp. abscessus]